MEASSASEEKSSRSVRRMSLSLPFQKDMGIHLKTNVRKIGQKGYISIFVSVFQSWLSTINFQSRFSFQKFMVPHFTQFVKSLRYLNILLKHSDDIRFDM